MDWTEVSIDDSPKPVEDQQPVQQQPQRTAKAPVGSSSSNKNASNARLAIPSAKKIRKATIDGIRIGVLPEYQDYGIVLQYLVNLFVKQNFSFRRVQARVPWLTAWLVNPFNQQLLNEELELAAKLEASRIQKHIQFMLQGGCCTRVFGRLCGCLCCCIPLVPTLCRVGTYFVDLLASCCWATCCDWWLGKFCRRYILAYLCFIPKWCQLKCSDIVTGDAAFEDEELSIRNIYESNSYKIANQYTCFLLLALLLSVLGFCMVTVSYVYLPMHPDRLFVQVESVLGIVLLVSGCFGLQFFCRCTL